MNGDTKKLAYFSDSLPGVFNLQVTLMKAVTREDEGLHICYVWQERVSGIVHVLQGTFIISTSSKMGKPRAGSPRSGPWWGERDVWLAGAGGQGSSLQPFRF